MITVLKQIRYHNNEQLCKVDTLYCMLQVIEVLEKNFLVDDSILQRVAYLKSCIL